MVIFFHLAFNFFGIMAIKKFVQFQESAFLEVQYAIGAYQSFQVLKIKKFTGWLVS
jgi:hypothetical protein